MRFSDLKTCPFCGCEQFYEKQQVQGAIIFRSRFDGKEADNSEIYDNLIFKGSGRTYCDNCNHYLGNRTTDTVGIAADRKCLENSFRDKDDEVKDFFENAINDSKAFQRTIRKQASQLKHFGSIKTDRKQ